MKPYQWPPIWLMLGFLMGWVHFRPSWISGLVYAVALIGMVIWIMSDLNRQKHGRDINPE